MTVYGCGYSLFSDKIKAMKLNEQQQADLKSHISENWKSPAECQVCKKNSWNISNFVYELREFSNGNLVIGGSSGIFPVCPVTCNSCGNTIFINPLIAGIIINDSK
jgi:hypothetical protein